jgi:hypothetical protein
MMPPLMIAEVDDQAHEFRRLRNLLHAEDRADADVDRLESSPRDDRFDRCRNHRARLS